MREEPSVALGLLATAGQLAKECRVRRDLPRELRRCLFINLPFNPKLPEI